jgi:type 1 glutamine amidotransferase
MTIHYEASRNILVVTKGHPFEKSEFFAMFDAMNGITWTHVEQPAAVALFDPDSAAGFDAFVLYDMPGMLFNDGTTRFQTEFVHHPPQFEDRLERMLDAGKPLIFLHHAIAGWPTCDRYAEVIGGRFHFRSRGTEIVDDGFRHDTQHRALVACHHPITKGLEDGFEIEDELYLYSIDESDKLPLLRSDYEFESRNFSSTEIAGRTGAFTNEGWKHRRGSNLLAWLRRERNSPIIYIQCGHGPTAYGNPGFRRLLRNAIDWSTSADARRWISEPAAASNKTIPANQR